jgi:ubiquinone/menaquinone biosynthesis C-methylase UbiE
MHLSVQEIRDVYDRHAGHYDRALNLYRLIGLRANTYRLRAAELLALHLGDCVIDLGCGTGLSFPLILDKIGPQGRLIGVDLAPEMLAMARKRVERFAWDNVELVEADIAAYEYPDNINGVLAVGSFGYIADHVSVIEKISRALVPGGRLVILDGKKPDGWPMWLFEGFVWLFRPFRLNLDYFAGHPWESVDRFLQDAAFEESYGGLMYISSGTAPSDVA